MNTWKMKSGGVLTLLLAATFCMDAAAVNNPISYLSEINDCDVIKYNGEYYITGNWLRGDMLCSRDLESWGERTHVFSWNNTWHTQVNQDDPDYDIAAGHIRYINGIFHFYTQLDIDRITHATSAHIWGPYTEPVDSPFAENIDAETFLDEDGGLYFYVTKFSGGNGNFLRTMSDPDTFSGGYVRQVWTWIGSGDWEDGTHINEGPKVLTYRNRYYQLYAAYPTTDPNYSIGCVEASSPTAFSNAGKYPAPICTRTVPAAGKPEITHIGQPWVVEGLNGFEKWMGYFAQNNEEPSTDGRTQRIDRMHFFDRKLFIDGPTDRYTPGYHPGPAKPQLLNIFSMADGPVPAEDWTLQTGAWNITGEELRQTTATGFNNVIANRDGAEHFLAEANIKLIGGASERAGLTVVKDGSDWLRVGFDQSANHWFYQRMSDGVFDSGGYALPVGFDFQAYHKIQLQKDGNTVAIKIDDIPSPTVSSLTVNFDGEALPELFTDVAQAAFDGIIYTIGWDEYDSGITGWGGARSGVPAAGSWNVGANGITMANGTGYTFKGDLMPEYEFATQVYKEGATDGSMGIFAVAVDGNNYVTAVIDLTTDELVVNGLKGGVALTEQRVSVANQTAYNLRVAKLSDRVIFFVDGVEKLTLNETYGAAQVGLYSIGMSTRFNGIMAYRTEPDVLPVPWVKTDIGSPGFSGTVDYHDNALYMAGSGADIWGGSDQFTFVHADASGDWEVSARVVNLDESGYWAKSGIMFRESTSPDSAMVMVHVSPGDSKLTFNPPKPEQPKVHLLWRDATGAGAADIVVGNLDFPIWLKLNRSGNTFTGYYSSDGQSWSQVATPHTAALNSAGQLGFGVDANNNDRIATTVFDNINDPVGFEPISVGIPENVHVGDFTALTAPFRLHASDFFSSLGYSFSASQWQISSDSGFASTNWDSGVSAPLTYAAVPANIASPGDYGRARYQNDQGEWSAWSSAYLLDLSPRTIAHWRFEEGTAGVAHAGDQDNGYLDVSGNGNHLSSWAAGSRPVATASIAFPAVPQVGEQNTLALDFSVDDDLGTFGAQTGGKMIESHMFNNGWTVECTFKLNSLGWQVLVGKDGRRGDLGGAVGSEAPFWLKLLASNQHLEVLAIDNNDIAHWTGSLNPIVAGQWYGVAATYDNAELALWLKSPGDVDYVFQSSIAFADGVALGGFNNTWTIGRGMHTGNPVDWVDGVIDEVRISNVALDSSSFINAAVEEHYDFDVDGMADVWELQYFSSISNSVPGGNPDGDELDTFGEYALGGNPTYDDAVAYLPTYGFTVDWATYVYNRRRDAAARGLAYGLNWSEDLLGAWTYIGTSNETGSVAIDADFESVTNEIPVTGLDKGFVTLEVSSDK